MTIPDDTSALTLKAVRARLRKAQTEVKAFLTERANQRLDQLWTGWDKQFHELFEDAKHHREVAVSLVGGTGAGKSTLINALIGERVLPVSNMRACTAAVTEVSFVEQDYRAEIRFISRDAWQREIESLQADLRDVWNRREDDDSDEPHNLKSSVRDKLWAVYCPDENADISKFDPFHLVEHPEVQQYLDWGVAEVESTNLKKFREALAPFLESKHRFWPIVKSVSIRGPFASLSDGVKLVDLPGVNDPNEAREEVTKQHLKTCRYVWIVFNIKRALTKDTLSLMQSEDFMRQIVMDGRSDTLTFVGTAADDVDAESGIEEFGLDVDATDTQIVEARNVAVRDVVLSQLDDLSQKMASMAREQQETAAKLAVKLKASPIFTVSAREYLALAGHGRKKATIFERPVDTQIPMLRDHLQKIAANYGVQAHAQALLRQLNTLLEDIRRQADSQSAAISNQLEIGELQRGELGAAVDAARTFLDGQLSETGKGFNQSLTTTQEVLTERVGRAVERAEHHLTHVFSHWNGVHWATLGAVCRRGGVHVGKNGRNDFPADISKPILDGVAFAWSEFFGERLKVVLEKWTQKLTANADDYRRDLLDKLRHVLDLPDGTVPALSRNFETTEKVLHELLAQTGIAMESRILTEQRTLYENVTKQVQANMQAAFELAAEESGQGMKQRMVDILSNHANAVSRIMFDDARDAILGGVRSLNNWLGVEFVKMTSAVQRSADLAGENLSLGARSASEASLHQDRIELRGVGALIETLMLGWPTATNEPNRKEIL